MPAPGEHKTAQAHILKCVHEINWTYVPRALALGTLPVAPWFALYCKLVDQFRTSA